MNLWPVDPKSKEPSVSLALLLLSTFGMVVAIGIELTGKTTPTGLVTEFFYGCVGLYFGRRVSISKEKDGSSKVDLPVPTDKEKA